MTNENIKEQYKQGIFFLGYGYVAQYFCKSYHLDDFKIGASINHNKEKYFKTPENIHAINFVEIDDSVLDNYDNFVISIPPFYERRTDAIIEKFHSYFLKRQTPYKLIYLSATSVYGDHGGNKVQEDSQLKAQSVNGLARIACENKYLELQENQLANIIILRLAGIYGEKRNSILSIRNKQIVENKLSNRMISRIHVADIISIIRKIISASEVKNQIFNLADNNPCPTNEINDYICSELLKISKLPISNKLAEVRHSSFAMDNKIVDNSKLKSLLNYQLMFPSYKDGLQQIAKDLNVISNK